MIESIAGKDHAATSVINIMFNMKNKINEKVINSLPPISSANESKHSNRNRNNSQEEYHEIEAGRSIDGFKEFSRNSTRTGKSLIFTKRNQAEDKSKTSKLNNDTKEQTKTFSK